MGEPAPQCIQVDHAGRVGISVEAAQAFAQALAFSRAECDQIAIVVSELATNLIRHGGGGVVRVSSARDGERMGIRIDAEDHGPGIRDLEQALTDGHSTVGGLGLGLGTVNRLMDDLSVSSPPGGGTRVTCWRWVRPRRQEPFPRALNIGVATRPRRGDLKNGDAFVVKCWPHHALIGVIDGLGHGEPAQRAAQVARLFVEDHFDQSLDSLFRGVGRACRATRGVVMALARFALDEATFSLASVGNVEARILSSEDRRNFVVRRGIVGVNAPNPVVTAHPWGPDAILVLHSDGLHSHWSWHDISPTIWQVPRDAAQHLLQAQGKDEDDATVVVVRNANDGD